MKIERVACVGAGLIGIEWATLFALRGLQVAIHDSDEEHATRATDGIRTNLRFLERAGQVNEQQVRSALKRVSIHSEIGDAVGTADYVQESVFENVDSKKRVFSEIDSKCSKNTIIASSTSALLMSDIQRAVRKLERCVIVHPMNPVHIIPLVEIVPGTATSASTVRSAYEFMLRLGKSPVVCRREVPGFIVNRIQSAVYREAFDLVDKGVASVEEIDRAVMTGPGLRWAFMGPFLVMNLAGGEGGIEYWIQHMADSYKIRWETMATWPSIPKSAKRKVVNGIRHHGLLKGKEYQEIVRWRDRNLLRLLNVLEQQLRPCVLRNASNR